VATCFQCRVSIRAQGERIHAELATPARQLGLQPFLREVRPRADGLGFEALERVPLLGPLAVRTRIRVELHAVEAPTRIAFRARSGAVRIHSEFRLRPSATEEDVTDVLERVALVMPAGWGPLRRFVLRRARQAQHGLLENLRRRMEAREPAAQRVAGPVQGSR